MKKKKKKIVEPQLGGCLKLWLVLLLYINGSAAFIGLIPFGQDLPPGVIRTTFPMPSDWRILGLVLISATNCIFILGIWNWKQWGAYGSVVGTLIALAFVSLIDGGVLFLVIYTVGLVVLTSFISACWKRFELHASG